MADFRRLNIDELANLDSEKLIDYIRAAYRRGDNAAGADGLAVLVFRHERDVKYRVALKVPPADIEDVAQEALFSAIKSAFEGSAVGQFVSWLNTIVDRRIADYHRRKESRPEEAPYPEEHADAEEIWGESGSVGDDTGLIHTREAIEQVLAKRNEVHRAVIDLYVFEGVAAKETADRINKMLDGHPHLAQPMTNDNVHQIAKRFREDLRTALEDDEA